MPGVIPGALGPSGHGTRGGEPLLVSISRWTRKITQLGRLVTRWDGHPYATIRQSTRLCCQHGKPL